MKTTLQNNNYDTMLEASDWRFSAAIVGLMQYLDYYNLDYKIEDEYIYYNTSDISSGSLYYPSVLLHSDIHVFQIHLLLPGSGRLRCLNSDLPHAHSLSECLTGKSHLNRTFSFTKTFYMMVLDLYIQIINDFF